MTAQLGTDTRQQNAEAERLGDVVVGTGIEAEDRVGLRICTRQHDDRCLVPGPAYQAAGLAPIHVRQADVEQNKIEALRLGQLQRLGRGFCLDSLKLLMQVQLLCQRLS